VPGTENIAPDLLSLAREPLAKRVAALRSVWSETAPAGPLPSRAAQISGLIVTEAIRLIRLGTGVELADASLELARLLNRPDGRTLAERDAEAARLVNGAAVALAAAATPSSPGARLMVLRSWSGKAKEAVRILAEAQGQAMARSELRVRLEEPTESHLSHLLGALESSGLIVRSREGRNVTVHLGPIAREDEVQELIASPPAPTWGTGSGERDLHREIYAAAVTATRYLAASVARPEEQGAEESAAEPVAVDWGRALPWHVSPRPAGSEMGETLIRRYWDQDFHESYQHLAEAEAIDPHRGLLVVGALGDPDPDR
jgi:hypothetical protein